MSSGVTSSTIGTAGTRTSLGCRGSRKSSGQAPASVRPGLLTSASGCGDREQISVPTRHEEVSVERVPVEGREASEAEIGEDEVTMPVTEDEVVVEKRPVVKEELRIRKDVVEDEEIVEEDVRKEEVDVEDATTTRSRSRDAGLGDEAGRRGR